MGTLLFFIIVGVLIWFVLIYNALQRSGNNVKRGRADMMASMKKRIDLVGRLVDIAKSYGDHEKLTQITSSVNMASIGDAMAVSRHADQTLNHISSLAMAYPDLKANATYQQLMSQMHEIESNLQARRESYNAAVSGYNSYRSSLPQALFAASIGFPEAPFYTVDDSGLESLPEFQTDDGKQLKESLQRLGSRAGDLAQNAGQRLNTAIADARAAQGANAENKSEES